MEEPSREILTVHLDHSIHGLRVCKGAVTRQGVILIRVQLFLPASAELLIRPIG
jgi:hypothetical protein